MDLMSLEPQGPQEQGVAQIAYQGKQRLVAVPARLPGEPVLRGAGPLHSVVDEDPVDPDRQPPVAALVPASPLTPDPDLVMLIRLRKTGSTTSVASSTSPIRPHRLNPAQPRRAANPAGRLQLSPLPVPQDHARAQPGRLPHQSLRTRASTSPSSRATPKRSGARSCDRISAEWGAQRIKGLSLTTRRSNTSSATTCFVAGAAVIFRRSAPIPA